MTHTPPTPEELALLRGHLEKCDQHLHAATQMLERWTTSHTEPEEGSLPAPRTPRLHAVPPAAIGSARGRVIMGEFDGQNMVDETGKTYPVPANYASKSKLIEGQPLKLTITEEGKFLYKQLGVIEHHSAIGPLVYDMGQYSVLINGKSYRILLASVTFYRADVGDEVTILLPDDREASWGAVDNILPKLSAQELQRTKELMTDES